jgi:uncharacterized protein (DUF1697 family)
MPRYVAFLRAINVGGRVVKMDVLRKLFVSLGLSGVETFIASGNVVFESKSAAASLEGKIESCLHKALGYEVATFLRTDSEVAVVAKCRPFREADIKAAVAFCVGFVARPLGREAVRAVMGCKSDNDNFHVQGREVYWLCRKGQGESEFSNAVLEKRLGMRSTIRGMNTIARLAAKYPAGSEKGKLAALRSAPQGSVRREKRAPRNCVPECPRNGWVKSEG